MEKQTNDSRGANTTERELKVFSITGKERQTNPTRPIKK